MAVTYPPFRLFHSDALEALADLPDDFFHSMVTDPPAGVSFMGKEWDAFESRDAFVGFLTPIFRECRRVLKPGAFALVWALPRTAHWTAWALEEAGFEVSDKLAHMFGSGFPKSMDIAKAIQKKNGVEPIGELPPSLGYANDPQWNALHRQLVMPDPEGEAAKWNGWGTALKPGREDWILVQKPFKGTYADNVLKWGVGGINIDACRVGWDRVPEIGTPGWGGPNKKLSAVPDQKGETVERKPPNTRGRFPSNVLLSHSEHCQLVGTTKVKTGKAHRENSGGKNCHTDQEKPPLDNMTYGDENGLEEIELWACTPDCPVRILDSQSGKLKSGKGAVKRKSAKGGTKSESIGAESRPEGTPMLCYGDEGAASRFFYVAKPPRKEKEAGCEKLPAKTAAELTGRKEGSEGLVMKHVDGSEKANPYAGTSGAEPRKNIHPTVKSVDLMSYLCRLITPPKGIVLDCFMGSGSTGVAALKEGFRFIGIEREADYYAIAEARLDHTVKELSGK